MKKEFFLTAALLAISAPLVLGKMDDEEARQEKLRKLTEAKKVEINGTQWEVHIKASGGKGTLPDLDTLTFQDGKFTSKYFSGQGFNSTNYTLTVEQEKGPTVWETMQTSEKGGITFWRGEWKDDVMTGIISRQLEKGNEEYSFTSSKKESISPTSEEEKTEEASETPAEEPAASETPVTTEKKKSPKKGLFTLDSEE